MKKTISIISLIIVFFILYFLQINFFSWFNIAGIKPNLFIVLELFIALFVGRKVAMPFGFFMGLYLDVLTGSQIGIASLMYLAIGFLGENLDKSFSKDSKLTILLMVSGCTVAFETVGYFYTIIRNAIPLQFLGFIKILVIEVIFNLLLTIILYPMIRKYGDSLENIFKPKKFLSRYF
ncbi:MAG: rod shape-determining protein MreD [Clostridia bacterium]|nr:rod shape-determining protein MreD [Clostridia bacterium]